MIYDVRHRTEISYEQQVTEAHHVLHLMPRSFDRQTRIAASLTTEPEPSQLTANEDYFGNSTHHLLLHEPHEKLIIDSFSRVDVQPRVEPLDLSVSPAWEDIVSMLRNAEGSAIAAQQFVFESPQIEAGDAVREYVASSFGAGRPLLALVMEVTERIFDDFEYEGGVSDVSTPVTEVLEMRRGVCQDFAHLQIACLRSFGLAARYVSGYLLTHPPPGQPKLVGADASHAWISVWAGDVGWVDFDPTNRLIPTDEHITVGWGRDYSDVSPTNGFIVGGGEHEVNVAVDVSQAEANQAVE
ncbi:MAG: transglutaminase family protein [Gammaproteobacteria bacterium]|jgi:transglutaminase-like putative cysteine protease